MNIKICGITNESEIDVLNEMNVDYAGFVFYEKSKRNLTMEKANALKSQLKKQIKSVAVCVSPDEKLLQSVISNGFDIVQIHGTIPYDLIENLQIETWIACNVAKPEQISEIKWDCKIDGIVMDAPDFGSGKTFDWDAAIPKVLAEKLKSKKFILAGGLQPDNVGTGIKLFQPTVVDVSSGVEYDNGIGKDPDKIRNFVERVRENE